MIELADNRYGKSAIRLVKVVRGEERHIVRDLTIAIALDGDFGAAHTDGDNSGVVATDTMKNTAYAFAKDHLDGAIEAYGRALAEHFIDFPQVEHARVTVREHHWEPLATPTGRAAAAFVRDPSFTRLAVVSANAGDVTIEAGIEDLALMKTAGSAFSGFPRDRYTTLPETEDRIMATQVSARWRYRSPELDAGVDHDTLFEAVLGTLLEVFAAHDSPSVQASIWIVGRAILERHSELQEIFFSLPNLHHLLVDLAPFGLENDNEVFVATGEPHGLIEATIRRS
ncbi:MAG: factor-independent urate hydroxylase [Candidatus Limnocylindrales bacterium]